MSAIAELLLIGLNENCITTLRLTYPWVFWRPRESRCLRSEYYIPAKATSAIL